ncbi:MAG TPA: hypothetical protein VLA51_06770, partial [Paracoccaceae bacterium]|nr:hypothetical protein [Paracoccaceae bacterium]
TGYIKSIGYSFDGVHVSSTNSGDMEIHVDGIIRSAPFGAGAGVRAEITAGPNTGNITVEQGSTGKIYGVDGIVAKHGAVGDITVDVAGLVVSRRDGVATVHNGTGKTEITAKSTADIRGGINAQSGVNSTGIKVTGDGGSKIDGGIYVRESGTGAVAEVVSYGSVTAVSPTAINVGSSNGTSIVTVGGTGTVYSKNSDGIYATAKDGVTITTGAGTVTGLRDGIDARSSGDIKIETGAGKISGLGFGASGIYSKTYGSASSNIIVNGDVYGANRGVFSRGNFSTGDLEITTVAGTTIEGKSYNGISTLARAANKATIKAYGAVKAGSTAIYAFSSLGGEIDIT